jgi:hypothetical protein
VGGGGWWGVREPDSGCEWLLRGGSAGLPGRVVGVLQARAPGGVVLAWVVCGV